VDIKLDKQLASVRTLAVQVLMDVFEKQRKADGLLDYKSQHLEGRDRGLLYELVLGVLRRFYSLEADFSRFLKQKPDIEARMTLFIGTYQLRYMRVPSHAAVSECVEVMKVLQPKASGMVNAVLRKVDRSEPPKKLKPHQRAELPNGLYRIWRDAFGADEVQNFAKLLQTPAPLCVAVLGDRDAWLQEVLDMGVVAEKGQYSPYAVLFPDGAEVQCLPGFTDGAFTVMDQAAQMAVMALDAPDDGVILDVCAAPGGKTALLAHCFPKAQIIALELNGKRIPRLQENIKRLACENVQILQADALHMPCLENSVGALFLDAPCSASGILRRHPDAKFLHNLEAVGGLAVVQKNIIQSCLQVLKEDCSMVYAVCSINPQENEQVLEGMDVQGAERILPSDEHDGFFWASLKKPPL